jgi:2-polyprenyl-6-methoxyphenol hydroxylase-like FAD-dependent oxidoreductase
MPQRILITGASVAGATTAWWLGRHGFDVEVVEKAPAFREGGQNVDVRGAAREVLRRMGLEAAAQARTTGERGTDWVDSGDRPIARFAVDDIGDGPTAELEILRGDIARLIFEPAARHARFRFGDGIAALTQDADGVDVRFESGRAARYDLVIVAEGVGAPTRERVFPGETRSRWLDITIAYFSIPRTAADGPFARVHNITRGRGATLKPGPDDRLHVYLGQQKTPGDEAQWGPARQKAWLHELFDGEGWQFPRILAGMDATDDFYFDVLRQVKMPRWSNGRVVLTGDAAWCATPMSGIGTSLAIVGGYVLAGELARSGGHRAAFDSYERILRPYVQEGQNFPKLLPRLLWPHSAAGLSVLRGAMRLASTPLVRKTFSRLFVRDSEAIDLPDYAAPPAG